MKLRNDPATSAMMAGALARNNAFQLTGMIGRRPTEGELYAAHFLGPDGAGKLVNAAMSQPSRQCGVDVSVGGRPPTAAFSINRDGSARTVSEVYARLTRRFDNSQHGGGRDGGAAGRRQAGDAIGESTVAALARRSAFLSAIPVAQSMTGLLACRHGIASAGRQ